MNKKRKIYVAGHRGLVGSAIARTLLAKGYESVVGRTHTELDLEDQGAVAAFYARESPAYVILAAAKVGGIMANQTFPADFIRSNLAIQSNIIEASYRKSVEKLLFLGSSCIYPKFAQQPIKEEYLLSGVLEPTNEPYAIAKIAGIRMCQSYNRQFGTNYISVMPTNLYGPGDSFDLQTSHVLPALIRKFHEAKIAGARDVVVWGTGEARREFLHVDDMAEACVYLMEHYNSSEIINIGSGEDIRIADLASLVRDVVDFRGDIVYDRSKPDGTPRKLLDVSRLRSHGWSARISLRDGIANTYSWFLSAQNGNTPPARRPSCPPSSQLQVSRT